VGGRYLQQWIVRRSRGPMVAFGSYSIVHSHHTHSYGRYHTALELKKIPFLGDGERRQYRDMVASDVMNPAGRRGDNVVTFFQTETVRLLFYPAPTRGGNLLASDVEYRSVKICMFAFHCVKVSTTLEKLSDHNHNGFPVVRAMPDGRRLMVGTVLRHQLYTLIAERQLSPGPPPSTRGSRPGGSRRRLSEDQLSRVGIHRSSVPNLIEAMTPASMDSARSFAADTLDLGAVMNPSPFVVDPLCPLPVRVSYNIRVRSLYAGV
jgi:hypothetical protein